MFSNKSIALSFTKYKLVFWLYCNNIAVVFKINYLEAEINNYDGEILSMLDNKLFRVKKKISSKLIDGHIIKDEIEYSNFFYKYIGCVDPTLRNYITKNIEIKLTPEIVSSINLGIKEDRWKMIEEAKINYPLKTFQGIDIDLRYATIMPNLGSEFWSDIKGVLKHVELKLGWIVPK